MSMCVEGSKVSFGRVEDGKSTIIEHKVVKTIFVIGGGHEHRSRHFLHTRPMVIVRGTTPAFPTTGLNDRRVAFAVVEHDRLQVRNQLRIYKTRHNNIKESKTEQSQSDYKGARPYTRSIIQLQTLGPPCLEPHVSVSIKEQSQGMHTQEVPEPCQRLVRWSVWHSPLWRGAGSCQCSAARQRCENEASTRRLGAMSARTL